MKTVTFLIKEQKYEAKPALTVLKLYGQKIGTNKMGEVLNSLATIDGDNLSFDDLDKFVMLILAGIELNGGAVPEETDVFDSLLSNMEALTNYIQLIIECSTPTEQKKTPIKPKEKT
jgi:hypothetical protein